MGSNFLRRLEIRHIIKNGIESELTDDEIVDIVCTEHPDGCFFDKEKIAKFVIKVRQNKTILF